MATGQVPRIRSGAPSRWPVRAPLRGPLRSRAAAVAVLAVLLLLTAGAYVATSAQVDADAQRRFVHEQGRIEAALQARMDAYRQVLRGGDGLFVAKDGNVSRAEWHEYVAAQRLNETYPGIQGVGYAVAVSPEELPAHIAALRAEGFSNYTVWPPGPRAFYTSIVYLEPFAERNLRAFGYDMFSEPVRRAAMEQARDTGRSALSAKVTLVQETQTDVQTGFLIYLPVYRNGTVPETLEGRQASLQGWVYSPFRTRDFTQGVLGSALPEVAFDLYDGEGLNASALLLPRTGVAPDATEHPRFEAVETLHMVRHPWTLRFVSTPRFEQAVDSPVPLLILAGGGAMSLLVFGITLSLATTRERALRLADQMSQERRRTETRFRTIVETAQEGIWTLDGTGRTTYANDRMAALLGLSREDLRGQPLAHFVARPDRPRFEDTLARLTDGHVEQVELAMPRPDGSELWVVLTLARLPEEGGGGVLAVVTDMTARRRAEATEREAYQQRLEIERLQELDAAKTRLLNAASHELNTPLTPMQLQGEFLRSGQLGELNPRQRRAVEVLIRNMERLGALVEDVLDVARLQGGTIRMRNEDVELAALVEEAVESHAESARAAEVTLERALAKPVHVRGDPHRLMQVLFNLLNNAIKFTPPGGRVRVTLARAGQEAVVRVQDSGIGMEPEAIARLFQPFSQVHDLETWNVGGTGLGLHITKGLVEHHGGRVEVRSDGLGKGSTFTVHLPVDDGPA